MSGRPRRPWESPGGSRTLQEVPGCPARSHEASGSPRMFRPYPERSRQSKNARDAPGGRRVP
eukprot:9440052-Pyramimonas_sp.AAC.1